MIIVTGTKRSGTSMWMQILKSAGVEVVGEAFPGKWGEFIREANPSGFYESLFRQGIYFATNPDPRSGQFVWPKQVEQHAVKVFIPGLVRTDFSYVGRVLATMRPWRQYDRSLRRLWAMEDEWRAKNRAKKLDDGDLGERDSASEQRVRAGRLPPALEWWFQTWELVRDVATRRYAFHLTTYERVLADPEGEIKGVLDWLPVEGLDLQAAVAAVQPALRTQKPETSEEASYEGLDPADVALFDRVYDAVHVERELSEAIIAEMNKTTERLASRWDAERRSHMERAQKGVSWGEPTADGR
jgi:hypothetical protein